ncbi:hypothetical protein [Actinoplanes couchii]|uniref:Uncharacterized protein n=1 Tax=Actinoplanes couchii TaxID=403638 RepID=A0ABQ3XKD7_9ACTN|nr:hypothetical protein [Actinoplanes couchii]MDR6320562.1 hypothetical protein [Actinoplanes couchii]GID58964.1 hypothetical protein Aco03nite_073680 [Actinoplanes couchii]
MSSTGNPNSGNQYNVGQNVYATQKGKITVNHGAAPPSGKPVLILLGLDVIFFFYGMFAYTGDNTSGDTWRAGIFLLLVFVTLSTLGRWFRRRWR